MSMDINVQGGSSVKLLTAGKYCEEDIVVTATNNGDSINEIYNKWGAGDFKIDELIYDRKNITRPRAFSYLGDTEASTDQGTSIYIINATVLPSYCFQYSELNIVWLGNKDNWDGEIIIPDNKKFIIQNNCFQTSNFNYFVVNSNLLPEEAFQCGVGAFTSSAFTMGAAAIYVPRIMVNEWVRAIQEDMSITNFEDWVDVYAIEDYFTVGGKLK